MSIQDLTDQQLMYELRIAMEEQNGRYIKALKEEMNRRCKYE
jgi:hypothetical protein